jgi:hypothetical protein
MLAFWAAHAEAFFWVAAQIAFGVMGAAVWPRLKQFAGTTGEGLAAGARLAHALAIPYLALLLGSVSARDTGLVGLDAQPYFLGDWLPAAAWAIGLGALASVVYAWRGVYPGATPGNALLDECRWGFYRGAALGWVSPSLTSAASLPHSLFGVLLGLGLAAIEWGLVRGVHQATDEPVVPAAGWLARACLSTLIFFLSRNLWVTLAVGTLVPFILFHWRARHA